MWVLEFHDAGIRTWMEAWKLFLSPQASFKLCVSTHFWPYIYNAGWLGLAECVPNNGIMNSWPPFEQSSPRSDNLYAGECFGRAPPLFHEWNPQTYIYITYTIAAQINIHVLSKEMLCVCENEQKPVQVSKSDPALPTGRAERNRSSSDITHSPGHFVSRRRPFILSLSISAPHANVLLLMRGICHLIGVIAFD
jgi:hypothetical protein